MFGLNRTFKLTSMLIALLALYPAALLPHSGENHADPESVPEPVVVNRSATVWGKNYFPNPVLVTQDGKEMRFFDDMIENKIVAINFIFTSCEASCPVETARMQSVARIMGERLGRDVHFYSISIDPETDTPEVLSAYRKKFGIESDGWQFMTGNRDEINNLRVKLGLFLEGVDDNSAQPEDHNLSLIIGNQATGRWMKRSPFEDPNVLALQINDWLGNWTTASLTESDYASAPEVKQEIAPGEKLFRTRCRSCHKIAEAGGIGPDLYGVTQRRDRDWLMRWIRNPDRMIAERDTLALSLLNVYKLPMPNMRLSEQDVKDVLEYLEEETQRRKTAGN